MIVKYDRKIFIPMKDIFSYSIDRCNICRDLSVLRKMLNGSDELEILREEEVGPGQHQLVALADGHVGHTSDI